MSWVSPGGICSQHRGCGTQGLTQTGEGFCADEDKAASCWPPGLSLQGSEGVRWTAEGRLARTGRTRWEWGRTAWWGQRGAWPLLGAQVRPRGLTRCLQPRLRDTGGRGPEHGTELWCLQSTVLRVPRILCLLSSNSVTLLSAQRSGAALSPLWFLPWEPPPPPSVTGSHKEPTRHALNALNVQVVGL